MLHRKLYALLEGAWSSQEVIAVRPNEDNATRMEDIASEAANAFQNVVQMGWHLTGKNPVTVEDERATAEAEAAAAAKQVPGFTYESGNAFIKDTDLERPAGDLETEVGGRRNLAASTLR
ncbi:MAG TPA: hypothetical protein VNL94_00285 [Candidatus Binatia bacterium]|nr:hypothetical protein [Candidatus Binatia bacterium]